jgi:triphosphoribosyl-dephospho-CoA synthase
MPVLYHKQGLRDALASAYKQACTIELEALKPGNVHRYADGHQMTREDFVTSADVSVGPLTEPTVGLGERIFRSVAATRDAVGCNTNLGILLLCAPLIQALLDERQNQGSLRERLHHVLQQADAEDTRWLFNAIELAAPGGLGESDKYDVRQAVNAPLLKVMAYAAGHDHIARLYTTDYENLFVFALPRLQAYERRWQSWEWATAGLFLDLLAHFPDTHVQRKFGLEKAVEVSRRAAVLSEGLSHADQPEKYQKYLLQADTEFKREDVNPGTTADLTVASLFILKLEQMCSAFESDTGFSRTCDSRPCEVGFPI